MEIFMEHWLSFIAGGFLLAMILYGHYRGFLRIAVTVASLVLSIAIAHMATPYVTGFIRENTGIRHMVEGILTDVTGDFGEAAKLQLPAQQRMMIEQMELPQPMKDALLENNKTKRTKITT